MLRRGVNILAVAVTLLAGGWLLMASAQKADPPKPDPVLRGVLYAKWKELGLTKDQTQKIYKIQGDYRARIADLEAKIKQLKVDERKKAEEILTPAQKARLKELLTGDTAKDPEKKDK